MSEKPIIRHCENCSYSHSHYNDCGTFESLSFLYCDVRYIDIENPRLRALTCRHYEPKNSKEAQDND